MYLSDFSQKNKRLFVFLIAGILLAKILLAVYFSHLGNCRNPELSLGYLAKATGDTFSYLDPIDNYLTEGEYYFWNGARKVFAGRMPYYGLPYFCFRLFFAKPTAADLMVLLQILFDALATVYFGALCFKVVKRRAAFWLGLALYALSFNYFINALYLSPESFSLSFTVLFLYNFHSFRMRKNKTDALAASLWLSLAILLKPYLLPLILAFFLEYLIREKVTIVSSARLKEAAMLIILMSVPLCALLLPWFVRNTVSLQKMIITQESATAGYDYTEADFAFRRFAAAWGGDATFWDAKSPACYFKLNPPVKCDFSFPEYGLSERYAPEDIESVRADYLKLQQSYSPALEETVVAKFDKLTDIYKDEKPFMFYIGSGFIRLKTVLWHTNNYSLPIHQSNPCYQPVQSLFKIIQFLIYAASLSLGLIGLMWLLYKEKISLIFLLIPVYLLAFFCFYFRVAEARIFAQAYPVMLLGLVTGIVLMYSWIKNFLYNKT